MTDHEMRNSPELDQLKESRPLEIEMRRASTILVNSLVLLAVLGSGCGGTGSGGGTTPPSGTVRGEGNPGSVTFRSTADARSDGSYLQVDGRFHNLAQGELSWSTDSTIPDDSFVDAGDEFIELL